VRPVIWDTTTHFPRYQAEKFVASKALLAGFAIVGGLYFIGWWVVPFVKAIWSAR
jgi:hypothetical protein